VWVEDVDSAGNRVRVGYDGAKKLISTTTPAATFTWLYDLEADPGESKPVRDGTGAEPLRLALRAFAETPRPENPSPPPAIDAEREAQLRALGYIH
jgi:YD repeat-containing protein